MLDLIPWLDETYIVEMGRLFLEGGCSPESTLLGLNESALRPLYYVGPLLQELAFRCFGIMGVRITPYVGLAAAYLCFRKRLRGDNDNKLCRPAQELVALSLLTSPILFQSVLLSRIDSWAIASVFAALAILGAPNKSKDKVILFAGSFFAVLSLFIWPTSAVLLPAYPVFSFSKERPWELLWFCLFAMVSLFLFTLPVVGDIYVFLLSFSRHYSEVTSPATSFSGVMLPIAREIARSPFIALLFCIGVVVWLRCRRIFTIAAFVVSFSVCTLTGLYTFRVVYLLPFIFFAGIDAVKALWTKCPRLVIGYLAATVVYGVLTGPVGHFGLSYPTLPKDIKETLSREIGTGPIRVFSPDHATYYIGRELGWKQIGFARPNELDNADVLARVTRDCDAAVLRDFDPYVPFQQSCTPYGLFCRYVLAKAREEKGVLQDQKSWAARFGGQFSFSWHAPLRLEGFKEVARSGMIRVFKRCDNEKGDIRE